jgi:hypothetical protein
MSILCGRASVHRILPSGPKELVSWVFAVIARIDGQWYKPEIPLLNGTYVLGKFEYQELGSMELGR